MAQAPLAAAPPTSGAAGMPPDPSADMGADDGNVLVTICGNPGGPYTVYAGDEPDSGEGGSADDGSEDDADTMGDADAAPAGVMGGVSAPQGQPAASDGAALKITMTILQSAASSQGGPGSADDQLNAGFSASQSPTPASGPPAQKY